MAKGQTLQQAFLGQLRSLLGSDSTFRAKRNAGRGKVPEQIDVSLRRNSAPARINRVTQAPDGECIYAIGDVHGRRDLLEQLVAIVEADAAGLEPGVRPTLVFLGDYIDRGLQSRDVIEFFLSDRLAAFNTVFLVGNHEEALLNFVQNAEFGPTWARFGGLETLFSYGFQPPNLRASLDTPEAMAAARDAWERVWQDFRARIPQSHLQFMENLEAYHIAGDYLFVHAGLRPGFELSTQSRRDMLWIRDEFLDSREEFPWLVVHGHTPSNKVYRDNRRICIDTGAFISGKLSAVRLCGTEIAFLTT